MANCNCNTGNTGFNITCENCEFTGPWQRGGRCGSIVPSCGCGGTGTGRRGGTGCGCGGMTSTDSGTAWTSDTCGTSSTCGGCGCGCGCGGR